MPKTKKPTGIQIVRSGNTYTVTWKIGDKDYGDGQQFQYRRHLDGKWSKWTSVSITKGQTAKALTFSIDDYSPKAKKPVLASIQIRIRGNRKSYKESYTVKVKNKSRKGTHKERRERTVNPGWSDWSPKIYDVVVPNNPTVSAAVDDELENVTKFSWNVVNDTSSNKVFTDVEWQAMLVKECSQTNGSKLVWKNKSNAWMSGTGSASSSKEITEDTTILASASYTRWFRIRARGPQGASSWKYAYHTYAQPYQAVMKAGSIKQTSGLGYLANATWEVTSNIAHPIDQTTVQYCMTTPLANLTCPSGVGWTDGSVTRDTTDDDGVSFSVDDVLGLDECMYVRVNTQHDKNITYGTPYMVGVGPLTDPDELDIDMNQPEEYTAIVSAHNQSSVPDSFLVVLYKTSSTPSTELTVGIIPSGQTEVKVKVPNWDGEDSISFGVYAAQGSYTKTKRSDGVFTYEVEHNMRSDNIIWGEGDLAKAPENVQLSATKVNGQIRVVWDWSWSTAVSAQISWSDSEIAWESNEEPNIYDIDHKATGWYIEGLESGKPWYVRVRLLNENDKAGPWSTIQKIDLAVAPLQPNVTVSEDLISQEGSTTLSWDYVSGDGTEQVYAEVCEYSESYVPTQDVTVQPDKTYYVIDSSHIYYEEVQDPIDSEIENYYEKLTEYGDPIAHTSTAQSVILYAEFIGWTPGVHTVRIRTVSESGKHSPWSDPVSITVAEPLEAIIQSTSLENIVIPDEEDPSITREVLSLTTLPLNVTVTGAGVGGITTVSVERANSYHIDRPDEDEFDGYEGENLCVIQQVGEEPITINPNNIIGFLDDGARYKLIANVQDGLGQSSTSELEFEVHWSHQAIEPLGTVEIDQDKGIALITAIAPEGTVEGDTFDVYRLSADKPQLILESGTWGVQYVDPYPTIGTFGGHRIVFRTKDGDYITTENKIAWLDLTDNENDYYDGEDIIIDFNGEKVVLEYKLSWDNSWGKDFKETAYLGGSIQGDWNPSVHRTSSVNGGIVAFTDPLMVQAMRRLADWPGICHVRTPEGSSFAADVQVTESRDYNSYEMLATFSLTITRVDAEELDGIPYSQWIIGEEE